MINEIIDLKNQVKDLKKSLTNYCRIETTTIVMNYILLGSSIVSAAILLYLIV